MSDCYMNIFRPYNNKGRDEISVTRSFMITCSKSIFGTELIQSIFANAGIKTNVFSTREKVTWELEVPADKILAQTRNTENAFVLCISPEGCFTSDAWATLLSHLDEATRLSLKSVVFSDGSGDIAEFERELKNICPDFAERLPDTEMVRQSILFGAYWDIWRIIYAGARPDALISNLDFTCLVESKIWGSVPEVQARNHSLKSFGVEVPIHHVTWQQVYDAASRILVESRGDAILKDFRDYLGDFPQLVRWNGFDEDDLCALNPDTESKIEDAEYDRLSNRFYSRYWQCMEDLVKKYDYRVKSSRGNDWDFTPTRAEILGNLGIGFWDGPQLAIKWCVGYQAWEMDVLMEKSDIIESGKNACLSILEKIGDGSVPGATIQFEAVQRFNFIRVNDMIDYEGERIPMTIENLGNITDYWVREIALLLKYQARRGVELSAADALVLKKQMLREKKPDSPDINSLSMRTSHSTWRLFAAFNLFVWIDPPTFFKDGESSFLPKDRQLERFHRLVTAVSDFAETISAVRG